MFDNQRQNLVVNFYNEFFKSHQKSSIRHVEVSETGQFGEPRHFVV